MIFGPRKVIASITFINSCSIVTSKVIGSDTSSTNQKVSLVSINGGNASVVNGTVVFDPTPNK